MRIPADNTRRIDTAPAEPADFERELLDLLARQGRRLPIPVFIVAAVIAGMAARHHSVVLPSLWLGLVVAVLAVRWSILGRLPTTDSISVRRRLHIAIALNALSGITQGLSLYFFFFLPDFERAIHSMLLIGFCAGSVARTGGHMPMFLAYLAPTIVPLSLAWAISAAMSGRLLLDGSMAVLIALLGVILTALARDTFRLFKDSFDIRLQQVELNARLRAALETAEEASRAKTRFLASASHDLRQPMHSLGVFAAALAMRPLDERSRGIVAHMNEALSELGSELDSLLDISKLDANLVRMHPSAVRLRPLLERLQGSFAPAARAKRIDLHLECPQDVCVRSDKTLLERVLRNLIDNAIKYTTAGSVRVHAEADGGQTRIVIADTGRGIPEAEHERVFEEFYQIENRARDRTQGLGLGLAIVKRLLDLLEIDMRLKSSAGAGTEFTLILQNVPPDDAADAIAPAAVPTLAGIHVLVVDDEARIRIGMRELLEHLGCEVTDAASTADAAAHARARRPDVLLVDFRLRGEDDGLKTIGAIRADYPDLPALLISGDTAAEQLARADAVGMTLLHKPVAANALARAIGGAVGRVPGEAAATKGLPGGSRG